MGSPCKVGCTGPRRQDQLTFCTNFNNRYECVHVQCLQMNYSIIIEIPLAVSNSIKNIAKHHHYNSKSYFRPSESFRQCNNAADRMAKNIFYQWIRTGVVQHPLHTLFVSNLENCLTDMWKVCCSYVYPRNKSRM